MHLGIETEKRKAAAFTMVELAAVLAVLALLAGLGWLSVKSAVENRRRAQCQANLHQIGAALQLYAKDYAGRLPDCTADNPHFQGSVWPWDVHMNLVAELEQRGATRKVLYCPSNPGMNDDRHWDFPKYTGSQTRVLGYVFLFAGCRDVPREMWRVDLRGDAARKPSVVELAADATVSQNWDYSHIKGFSMDRTSHLSGSKPAGGNVLFEDGNVAWRPFAQMKHQIVGQVVWDF